jgi:mono/diheme cytochrome c family protein
MMPETMINANHRTTSPRMDADSKMTVRHRHQSTLFTRMAVAFALTLSVFAASAQTNSASVKNGDSVYAELAKAPKKAAARRNPLAADPEAVAAGGKLFSLHCAECHGEMAEGGKKAPSLIAGEVQQAPPGSLFWLLTNGVVRRGMPVWSKLPEPQRWQLVSFIKSLTPSSPRSPGSPDSPPPAR